MTSAIEWALSLHKLLLAVKWPALLDKIEVTGLVKQHGRIIRRGVRAKVGVYADQPDDLVLHGGSGRADYFGTFVNRCARLLACASSGQIVGLQSHVAEALDHWNSQQFKKQVGIPMQPRLSDAGDVTEQRAAPSSNRQLPKHVASVGWHARMSTAFTSLLDVDNTSSCADMRPLVSASRRSSSRSLWTGRRKAMSVGGIVSTQAQEHIHKAAAAGLAGRMNPGRLPNRCASFSRRTQSPVVTEDQLQVGDHNELCTESPSIGQPPEHPLPASSSHNDLALSSQRSCQQRQEHYPAHSSAHPEADGVNTVHEEHGILHEPVAPVHSPAPTAVEASVEGFHNWWEDLNTSSHCINQQMSHVSRPQDESARSCSAALGPRCNKRMETRSDSSRSERLRLPPAAAVLQDTPLGGDSASQGTLSGTLPSLSGRQSPRSPTSTRVKLRSHRLMFQHNSMRQANRTTISNHMQRCAARGPVAESAEEAHLLGDGGHSGGCEFWTNYSDDSVAEWDSSTKTQDTGPSPALQVN